MKLGKIEKFVLLYLFSRTPHRDWWKDYKGVEVDVVYGRVDRTHLIFQFYQTRIGNFSVNYKGVVRGAIPEREYKKLQSTFSRALGRLREKGLITYEKPFGRQSNRTLTERRIGVDVTDSGKEEMMRLVRSARQKLQDPSASMNKRQIQQILGLTKG